MVKKNKYETYQNLVLFITNLTIFGTLVLTWAVIWFNFFDTEIKMPFFKKGHYFVFAVYGILLFIFTQIFGGYKIGYYRKGDVLFSATLGVLFTNTIIYFQVSLLSYKLASLKPIFILTVLDFLLLILWVNLANFIYLKLYPSQKILMVYEGRNLSTNLVYKMSKRSEKYDICEAISLEEGLEKIYLKIMEYNTVLISDVRSPNRNSILKFCYKNNIKTYTTPKISDIIIRGSEEIDLFDTPIIMIKNFELSLEQRIIKRIIDIIISLIGVIVTSPIMIVTAILIKLNDKGPIFYKQKRLTKGEKVFFVYKFRSMVIDAEKEKGAQLAEQDDGRVTKVGRFIRRVRIDELPQLFNILKGEMSVVGPRPERPELALEYEKVMEEFTFRLKVKSGLTGYAQVTGKYNTTPYDKLKMDLMYIINYNIFADIKIMIMTIKVLFTEGS